MHQKWTAAFECRIRNWAGVSMDDKRGMIGGRTVQLSNNTNPPYFRYNLAEKQVYFSINHLSLKNSLNYLFAIKKYKLDYMTGYAVSNYLLAKYLKSKSLDVPQLKAVITSSEMLTSHMRDTLQEVYQCEVYDSWSGIEACGLISECEYHSLHISPDVGIIEILDKNNNDVVPGEIGEVVCTGLINFDQPLVRYRIGDLVELSDNQNCKCGRNMPVISKVIGRTDDIVTLKDGRQFGSFNRVFAEVEGLLQAQVIQKSDLSIMINYTKNNSIRSELIESKIQKYIYEKLGLVEIEYNCCDEIPLEKNGKYKAVISHVTSS
jgi:phenylacetate-CoA ligase